MKRDRTLDIVKGIACLLMILAHPKTMHMTIDTDFTTFIWYIGFFAPVVFFASVGVSLQYQVNKRSKYEIILSNALLLTFVYISQAFNFDSLFTSLTISSVIAVFFLRWNSALLIIGVKLIDELLNIYGISPRHFHGTLFSVIPWIGFIFVGDYLHKNKNVRLPVFVLSSAAAVYLKFTGAGLYSQSPTPFFITLGLAIYSFSLLISPYLNKVPYGGGILAFFGKNTLLFLWMHFYLLTNVFSKYKLYAPYTWVLLLAATGIMMYMLLKLNDLTLVKISGKLTFWLVCLAVYVLIVRLSGVFTSQISSFILFIFAMNYHNFLPAVRRLTEKYTDRKTNVPVGKNM